VSEEPTLRDLLRSLASTFFSSLRRNKLATSLSVVACVVVTFLAFDIRYDERPRYRKLFLPEIERAEAAFLATMEQADLAADEVSRLNYFVLAHAQARAVFRIAAKQKPITGDAMRAHGELMRYYELVIEEIAIIRTEMSLNQNLDYLAEWKKQEAALRPIRDKWVAWLAID
jgi:hypothetical protein